LDPAKRLDRFITALSIAKKEAGQLKGVIIGDGIEKEKLQLIASKFGLSSDELVFLGSRNDVPELLTSADMLVLTSDHEGFPNVLLEAMAASLPIITTPAGDAGRLVQEGVNGFVVGFDDVEVLAKCMVQLAQSSNLRHRLGVAGRQYLEQNYGNKNLADLLLSIYSSIAQRRRNTRLSGILTLWKRKSFNGID
jgi:glycosyltransferase involved in cell wall biosynthesis